MKKVYIHPNTDLSLFKELLDSYWFAPQDVLQRSIEASIWKQVALTSPVLEIGVGDGEISRYLFRNKNKIDVGIDKNPVGLMHAMETGIYKKVIPGDAIKLPFLNNSFKTVISNSTFEHITYDKKAVNEVSRILKPSGLFIITVPTNNFPKMIREIEKNSKDKDELTKKINRRLSHFHYRSLNQWGNIFFENKLTLIFYSYYFPYDTFKLWYSLLRFSTQKFRNKEIWSYLRDSRLSKFIPKKIYKTILFNRMRSAYDSGLKVKTDFGAQIIMIAQKMP